MQWILQEFEDTHRLGAALSRLGLPHSWHKVVPFVGDLLPEPVVEDPGAVILFGSYTLWRYAEAKGYRPGVFKLRPFVHEPAWHRHLLNGPDALFLPLRDVPARLANDGALWFMRPVDDSKETPGRVYEAAQIIALAEKVLTLGEDEIPQGSLRHDTALMLSRPVRILKEWRVWVVADRIVTASLYKEGARIVYRQEIDPDALAFAEEMVSLNPGYQAAYVLDICRSEAGLKLLETNCINAAGFYAANLERLVQALEDCATR
ncbi:MAG: ATP-grasp domain-containing protein [Pseudomonadota bacterium]